MPGYRSDAARSSHRAKQGGRILGLALLTVALLMTGLASPATAAVPTVSSVAPSKGPLKGGQNVVITGKDLGSATAVNFGDEAATAFAIMSNTQIVATLPDATAVAQVTVTVTNADGTNTTGPKYQFMEPKVKKLSPAWADPTTATIITITGEGFTGATAADVMFGTTAATELYVVSDTTIVAKAPIDDVVSDPNVLLDRGVTDVTVASNSTPSATGADSKFLFTPGTPTIAHLGATGDEVTGTDGAAVGANLTITGTQR